MIKYRAGFSMQKLLVFEIFDMLDRLEEKKCKNVGQWDKTLNYLVSTKSLSQLVPNCPNLGQNRRFTPPVLILTWEMRLSGHGTYYTNSQAKTWKNYPDLIAFSLAFLSQELGVCLYV